MLLTYDTHAYSHYHTYGQDLLLIHIKQTDGWINSDRDVLTLPTTHRASLIDTPNGIWYMCGSHFPIKITEPERGSQRISAD